MMIAAIPAKKEYNPQNGTTESSPGKGSSDRSNAALSQKDGQMDSAEIAVMTDPKIEQRNREHKLQEFLKASNLDALLVEDPVNLFYLTGLDLSSGLLFLTKKKMILFVDGRYFEVCQDRAPCAVNLLEKESLTNLFMSPEYAFIKTLGFDSETTSYQRFSNLEKLFQKIKEQSSGRSNIKMIPLDNPVKQLRMIKEKEEITLLRQSAKLCSAGFDYLCTLLKEGVKESELAFQLEQFFKRNGGQKVAFDPIIAFGSNSSMPHYKTGEKQLKRGDVVLIDIGVTLKNYQSDMTRMVFFGAPKEEIGIIHSIVERAQALSLEICKPGTPIQDIDAKAREFIQAQGYGDHFTHGIGHGVGLEIHELPNMRYPSSLAAQKLEVGMVLTVEPGIYLPKVGGVRIEDTILITETGYESLTKRPTEPVIL